MARFKVRTRFQLWVESDATGLSPAGPRLIKGDTSKHPKPLIEFVSDTKEEAEQNRARLEVYLNEWAHENKGAKNA